MTPGQAVDSSAIVIAPGQRSRDDGVEVPQEGDRFEVLAAAVDVGHPFAGLAAVVAIQHRGHRIHAQAVDVDSAPASAARWRSGSRAPRCGRNCRSSVFQSWWKPSRGSACSYSARAVEAGQAVRVGRKMRRHPVEDHADAGRVAAIDEAAKSSGGPKRALRREQAERLIAPGAAERMLRDRHQLDMGEAHVRDIGHQPLGQLVPAVRALLRPPAARSRMHLVDRDRRVAAPAARRGACIQSSSCPVVGLGSATIEAVAGGVSACQRARDRPLAAAARRRAPMISYL